MADGVEVDDCTRKRVPSSQRSVKRKKQTGREDESITSDLPESWKLRRTVMV